MTRTYSCTPTSVRMPADLKAWLEARSIGNFRSMNAEIVAILTTVRAGEKTGLAFEQFANPPSAVTEEEAA